MGCLPLTVRRLGTRLPLSLFISVRLLGTRLPFPEVVNSRFESMSTLLDFLFNLFSRDRRAHRSREPIFDRPSGSRERRVEEEVVFRYTAPGGGTATVPRVVKPYQVLQVTQNASRAIIKAAFKRTANYSRRQERVMASLSYHILTSKVERYQKISDGSYEITEKIDVFVLAAVGDTASLLAQISEDSSDLWSHAPTGTIIRFCISLPAPASTTRLRRFSRSVFLSTRNRLMVAQLFTPLASLVNVLLSNFCFGMVPIQ